MPAAVMQQSKKDGTNPTSFAFCLYNLDTLFLDNFQSCSETCNRQTHAHTTPSRNIAEEYFWKAEHSQFIAILLVQQTFQIADA